MHEVTEILSAIEQGSSGAAEELLPLVYKELRRLAAEMMAKEKPGQTLQPTALMHEAYIRLVDVEKTRHWDSRGHFFAAAAEAMRRIVVENARRKHCAKHGGESQRVDIEIADLPARMPPEELIALDEALQELTRQYPVKGRLVTMRYFGGMTIEQASEALGISRVTAHRYWTFARAWLYRRMTGISRGG